MSRSGPRTGPQHGEGLPGDQGNLRPNGRAEARVEFPELTSLFDALTAPGTPEELADAPAALAVFRRPATGTAIRSIRATPLTWLRRTLIAKVLVTTAAGAATVGAVAMTASVSGHSGRPHSSRTTAATLPSRTRAPSEHVTTARSTRTGSTAASTITQFCREWLLAADGERTFLHDSVAGAQVLDLAGGTDQVDGYCVGVVGGMPTCAVVPPRAGTLASDRSGGRNLWFTEWCPSTQTWTAQPYPGQATGQMTCDPETGMCQWQSGTGGGDGGQDGHGTRQPDYGPTRTGYPPQETSYPTPSSAVPSYPQEPSPTQTSQGESHLTQNPGTATSGADGGNSARPTGPNGGGEGAPPSGQ